MRSILFCFALLCCLPAFAAEEEPIQSLNTTAANVDQSRPWLTVIVPDAYRADSTSLSLLAALQSAPAESPLRRWIAACNVTVRTASDPVHKERHGKFVSLTDLPAVFLQKPNGAVLYKATRANVPTDGYALGRELDYYASLDPTQPDQENRFGDSRTYHGPIDWVSQCPPDSNCPDGNCPWQPSTDELAPALPDSSAVLPMPGSVGLVPVIIVIGGVILLGFVLSAIALVAFVVIRKR